MYKYTSKRDKCQPYKTIHGTFFARSDSPFFPKIHLYYTLLKNRKQTINNPLKYVFYFPVLWEKDFYLYSFWNLGKERAKNKASSRLGEKALCSIKNYEILFEFSTISSIKPYSFASSAFMKLSRSVSRSMTSIGWPVASARI